MFYQTYTGARKPPKVRHRALWSPRHPRGHGMVSSTAARHLQRTAHASQCIFNGEWLSSFPVLSMVTLTFELWPWHSNSSERRTKHVAASSVWIWRKSVQRIPIYLRHKQTRKSDSAENRTLLACHKIWSEQRRRNSANPARRLLVSHQCQYLNHHAD